MSRNVHASDSKQPAAFRVWQSLACSLNMYFSTGFFCVVLFRFLFPTFESFLEMAAGNAYSLLFVMRIISTLLGTNLFIQQLKVKQNGGGGGAFAAVTCANLILTSTWTCCSAFRDLEHSCMLKVPLLLLFQCCSQDGSCDPMLGMNLKKTHLESVCLQYQLYRLLNSHCFCPLKNGMGLIIFFLCAYVPKTEAGHCKWAEVLQDLERIKTSKDIDVSLYTANADEDEECQELVMRCFFLETEVIIQECRIKNCSKTQDVWNIWKNGNESFEKNKLTSTKSEKCKECEEYEEKSFTEFVQNFVKVIQRDCKQ